MTDYKWEIEECHQQINDTLTYKKQKDDFFNQINVKARERYRRKRVPILSINFISDWAYN